MWLLIYGGIYAQALACRPLPIMWYKSKWYQKSYACDIQYNKLLLTRSLAG